MELICEVCNKVIYKAKKGIPPKRIKTAFKIAENVHVLTQHANTNKR